jgi:hypothetical protein
MDVAGECSLYDGFNVDILHNFLEVEDGNSFTSTG